MDTALKKDCDRMLESLLGLKHSKIWWDSPNKAFDMETPINIFNTEPNRVYNYLMSHVSGEYF